MSLLLLLLIPAVIFGVVALLRLVLNWTGESEAWWAVPAWTAIAVPLAFGGVFACMYLGVTAFMGIGGT